MQDYLDGSIVGMDYDEAHVALYMPTGEEVRIWVPFTLMPKYLRRLGQPLRITASGHCDSLEFKVRKVEPFIGPPTREDYELQQWIESK